jgi:hypothetical protein
MFDLAPFRHNFCLMGLCDKPPESYMKTLEIIETKYGPLRGVTSFSSHPDGQVKSCMLREENTIDTGSGRVIPQYCDDEFGDRQKKHRSSLSFHPNGNLKSAAMQDPAPIRTTLGVFDAELVTFYEDGGVNRLFPLNGLVNGFWTENNERELAGRLDFDLSVGKFSTKVIAIHFYPGGALKSLTLWPGEKIRILTPIGEMEVRAGFSLYENGSVKSVEPARPTQIETPLGTITAFDPDVIGMHADLNSVRFSQDGDLLSLKSLATGIIATGPDGTQTRLEPLVLESLLDSSDTRIVPLKIDFRENEIDVTALQTITFDRHTHQFTTFPVEVKLTSGCGGCGEVAEGCSNCDGSCETSEGCANCDGSCGKNCVSKRG